MGDPVNSGKNEETLRSLARERIESGLLPRGNPARSWGGRGSGLACSLCDAPIPESSPEMELEFDGMMSCTAVRFHLQCQAIWEQMRQAKTESEWTPIEERAPPFDTVVEARLSMSGSRSVILGVVRTRGRGGEAVWLNATTNSRLPGAWRPLEWRHPTGLEVSEGSAAPKRA